jgi:hypothetical protein
VPFLALASAVDGTVRIWEKGLSRQRDKPLLDLAPMCHQSYSRVHSVEVTQQPLWMSSILLQHLRYS